MSQHTPGPWTIDPSEQRDISGSRVFKVVTDDRNAADGLIADVSAWWVDTQSARANARLIAAAPEMLALIRKDAENFDAAIHGRRLVYNDLELAKERRALLARIEGK